MLKVPNITVGVVRKGERVNAEAGKAFDFTEAEVEELLSIDPDYLRDPVNEAPVAEKATKAAAKPEAPKEAGL
jgi:hypothetical protein